ncbi:hypothetical protein PIROE2DRAFT_4568 [Piromyces sp. E2]|nr:hypothetical protein PIROE2DRAFT_4568 [Piromyces sp. E2]|eukprot:OUM67889.1 hypothetical protein PIROE2DRAFT_4568 [Piromyces sp. E2]
MNTDNSKYSPVMELILNFTNEFSDSFLYAYVIQIILIVYMYKCIGTGKYWKLLLAGSVFGTLGAVIEHIGTAWRDTLNEPKAYMCYLLAEVGWITSEFSIPFLNLIKLNTLSQSKLIKVINYVVGFLFVLFSCSRFYIGYLRLVDKELFSSKVYHAHGIAFSIIAVADGLLSIFTFVELSKNVKKAREKDGETFNLLSSFKKSSLFILFVVDLMSVILAILSIFINDTKSGKAINRLVKPFHAIKSNFLLILAVDAFIFKMRASIEGSSVSHYVSHNSKQRSNHGDYTDEIPLSNKKYRYMNSSQMLSGNTVTNSNNYSNNYSGNYSATYSGNHNMNLSSNSHGSNSAKRHKGHHKNNSVSENNYYMGFMNNNTTDIINSNNHLEKTSYSTISSSTLNDSQPTRAYIKGKRLTKAKSMDANDRSINTSNHSGISVVPLIPLNYSGNHSSGKSSSPYLYQAKNNRSPNITEASYNSNKGYEKSSSSYAYAIGNSNNYSSKESSTENYSNTNP